MAAPAVLAHIAWVLGGIAATWAAKIWVGLTTFLPTSFAFFDKLNYSATVVQGLWVLGLLLVALHLVLHMYRRHSSDGERFPGQLGSLTIPHALRWMRILLFVGLVAWPTVTQVFTLTRMFRALEIVHNDGKETDADAKKGMALLTDFGTTTRREGRSIFHGWHWRSWNDDRKVYEKQGGVDAWPGLQPLLYTAGTTAITLSLLWLAFAPLPKRAQE